MKTSTGIILLGAAAIAAYAVLGSKETDSNYAYSGETPVIQTLRRAGILGATNAESVQRINEKVSSNELLPQLSTTLKKNVTASVGGKTYSGNVAIIAGNTKASYVGVTQPERNQGLTATDRLILSNKGVTASVKNAKKYGLL